MNISAGEHVLLNILDVIGLGIDGGEVVIVEGDHGRPSRPRRRGSDAPSPGAQEGKRLSDGESSPDALPREHARGRERVRRWGLGARVV